MTQDFSQFQTQEVGEEVFAKLADLINELETANSRVDQLEEDLKFAKRVAANLAGSVIPDFLESLGLGEITTKDGKKVSVKSSWQVSVPATKKERAYKWLEDNGYGEMIKRQISVAFNRGQEDEAHKLLEDLSNEYSDIRIDRKVEPMTLKSFVNKQLESGEQIPEEIFGQFRVRKAIVK